MTVIEVRKRAKGAGRKPRRTRERRDQNHAHA